MHYTKQAFSKAFTGTSAQFDTTIMMNKLYRFTADQNCWVRITTTGTAVAAAGTNAIQYFAGQQLLLGTDDPADIYVSVISAGTNGTANLARLDNA